MSFFIWLFGLFRGLFGDYMWYHLAGWNCQTEEYDGMQVATYAGIVLILAVILTAVIYYYVINRPSFAKWWHWLIYNLLGAIIYGVSLFCVLNSQLNNGIIGDCIAYARDDQGNVVGQYITSGSCAGVALASFIIWIVFFFLFSMAIKWWSSSCKKTPF